MGGYSADGVGEQFVKAMLQNYNHENIHRYSLVVNSLPKRKNTHGYHTTLHQAPYSIIPGIASIQYWRFKNNRLLASLDEIKKIVEQESTDLVWIILNGSLTIQIGAALHKHIQIPYVAHVWDAPEYLIKKMNLDPFTKKNLINAFAQTMTYAKRGVVVSESMGRVFYDRYSISSSSMVLCPPKSSWREVEKVKKENELLIIFAGSLYAYKEWNSFLDAIEKYNNVNRKIKIKVTCIGNTSRWTKKKEWVNYEPVKPIDEAANAVSKADIAYLPYWMDKSHSLFVKTAFPGKMSFYVSSGTPVFFHGPEDSTPTQFLQKYKVGKVCHSKKTEDIINTIEDILSSDFQNQYKQSQKETLEAVFHPDRCVEIFEETIRLTLKPS